MQNLFTLTPATNPIIDNLALADFTSFNLVTGFFIAALIAAILATYFSGVK